MKIASSIDIKNSSEVVIGWLENPQKAMQWMTSVSGGETTRETPERVGTAFREVVEDENGSMEMHGVIMGFEADKSIAFQLESKVNIADVEYRVEKIDEGARLNYKANIKWKFPVNIISIFMGNKMRQSILAQLQDELNKLKKLCEWVIELYLGHIVFVILLFSIWSIREERMQNRDGILQTNVITFTGI